MKSASFYDKETGLFNGTLFVGSDDAAIALNIPEGHAAIEGHHDHMCKRVNVEAHSRHLALRAAFEVERITSVFQDSPLEVRQKRQAEIDSAAAAVLIDYQPPAPSTDHEWDSTSKRWNLSAAAQAKAQGRQAAQARIAELTASQHQHVRELLLGSLSARPRLQSIQDEIAMLSKTVDSA